MKRYTLTLAALLASVFLVTADQAAWAQRPSGGGGPGGGFGGGFGGGMPGGGRASGSQPSSGRSSASSSRGGQSNSAGVVAVADTRSNSLIISAPDELLPMIEELIAQMDSIIENKAEVQVFPLRFADADETADLVEDMFEDNRSSFGGRSFSSRSSSSQIEVTARADERTNSVIVSADTDKMPRIELMIKLLDQDNAREQEVYFYEIKNADPERMAEMIQEILDDNSRGGGSAVRRPTTSSTRTTGSSTSQRSNFGVATQAAAADDSKKRSWRHG